MVSYRLGQVKPDPFLTAPIGVHARTCMSLPSFPPRLIQSKDAPAKVLKRQRPHPVPIPRKQRVERWAPQERVEAHRVRRSSKHEQEPAVAEVRVAGSDPLFRVRVCVS